MQFSEVSIGKELKEIMIDLLEDEAVDIARRLGDALAQGGELFRAPAHRGGLKGSAQVVGATDRLRLLLLHVQRHKGLMHARPMIAAYGQRPGNTYLDALLALARQPVPWQRSLDTWKPRTHNARRQFASLARHLYAQWAVPAFMDSAWFAGDSFDAQCQQAWFLHLGEGENIRTARLPISYTKRMAHHFMLAPTDLTAEAALRWGQVQALGGSDRLCRAVNAHTLATSFPVQCKRPAERWRFFGLAGRLGDSVADYFVARFANCRWRTRRLARSVCLRTSRCRRSSRRNSRMLSGCAAPQFHGNIGS